MKISNKLLLGGLVFMLLSTVFAIGGFSYLLKNGDIDLMAFEYEPIVINRQTSEQDLDSLQRITEQTGGNLEFSKVAFTDSGELNAISGSIQYPCCSASFNSDSLRQVMIGKGIGMLKVSVNEEDPAFNPWYNWD